MNAAEWFFGDLVAAVRERVRRFGRWLRHRTARPERERRPRAYDPAFAERLASRRRHDFEVQSTIPHFDPMP